MKKKLQGLGTVIAIVLAMSFFIKPVFGCVGPTGSSGVCEPTGSSGQSGATGCSGPTGSSGETGTSGVEPSITPTAVPTNPPNIGGPGDGRSDGRSDGKSSCPECTAPPKTQGQVLGATTDFAGTGSAVEMFVNAIGSIGAFATAAGVALIAKKK